MIGSYRKRGCKCKGKKCTCGATWSYRIELGQDPKTGKRKQKEAGGFKTRAEAVAAAAKVYTEFNEGTYVSEKKITFKDFAEKWIEMYAASGKVKESTVDIRRSKLKKLLEHFAHIKIKNITKTMYQDLLYDLSKSKLAQKTIASVHETGSLIFKKAIELEIITKDPTLYAEVPKVKKTVTELEQEIEIPKYLEKGELAHFINTAKSNESPLIYPIFLILAYTGIRVGELCALKWRDIDFKNQQISINKTIYNKNNNIREYKLTPPKNNKSRTIDIDPGILQELETFKNKQNIFIMRHRDIYHDEGFVIAHEWDFPGYPLTITKVERYMTRILKLSGLNQVLTPHSLRHTHTSLLAEAGVSLEVIMERLGHQDDVVTKKVYLHVTKSKKKEASQKFAELMRSL